MILGIQFFDKYSSYKYFHSILVNLFVELVEYIIYGTVIQEVKTSNIAREVRNIYNVLSIL